MSGYSVLTRLLHWATALLVFVTVPAGMAMTSLGFQDISSSLYVAHKGLGVVILGLLTVRLLWRWVGPPPPPMPEAIPERERRLARQGHGALYLLLGVVAVLGYWRTAGGGYPVEILDALGVPPLVPVDEALADRLSVAHKFLAYLATAGVAVHVSAVLYHTWIQDHGILSRMWPPWRTGGPP